MLLACRHLNQMLASQHSRTLWGTLEVEGEVEAETEAEGERGRGRGRH